ncbi:septum formation protein Maf [Candidatus Woesearchaeota archaeon]|nr:septum formation protein Maf [Candidatus Woesearchaeota archaeon]
MRKIILASTSSRRRHLLETLIGKNFEVKPASYMEDNSLFADPVQLVLHHSMEKAKEISRGLEEEVVIACDTVVVVEREILGKPSTEESARSMLKKINNQLVEVVSGLAAIDTKFKKININYEKTQVKIKLLTEKEIDDYIKTGEPIGKAGAFAIQERAAQFIEKINGCYFNVVGLPIYRLNIVLKGLGIYTLDYK